jgi:hypothetical protein
MKKLPQKTPETLLLQDSLANVESIGRFDRVHTRRALHERGRKTIIRTCLAPTDKDDIPLRALAQAATANYIQQTFFPEAELQIVAPVNTLERVNGASGAREAAYRLFDFILYHGPLSVQPQNAHRRFMFDKAELPFVDPGRIACVMRGKREAAKLEKQATRRSSDWNPYLAAHIALHDVVESVSPVDLEFSTDGGPIVREPERIISIGAQSERSFYNARMRCRDTNVYVQGRVDATGQLFTRDSQPAYLRSPAGKHFDPEIAEFQVLSEATFDQPWLQIGNTMKSLSHLRSLYDAGFEAIGSRGLGEPAELAVS